jgi:hypothetical protein
VNVKGQINFSTPLFRLENLLCELEVTYLRILMAKPTKLTKAEEEKKKKAYYAKKEKKAKEVKK